MGPNQVGEIKMCTHTYYEAEKGYRIEKTRKEMGTKTGHRALNPSLRSLAATVLDNVQEQPGLGASAEAFSFRTTHQARQQVKFIRLSVNVVLENAFLKLAYPVRRHRIGKNEYLRLWHL